MIYLSCVVAKNDGIQVATIVMFYQIVGCVRSRIVAGSKRFLVMQRLIEGKNNLQSIAIELN